MAKFYGKTRSNYGSLTGTIIIWPVELDSTNPTSPENVSVLPAGYLRCDGSKYNATDYPDLAAICGTGNNCKFSRLDEEGEPIIILSDEEFVVPDLGSKYPRPVSGPDAGVYNNILTQTQDGVYIKRSGIGIEASSNVGQEASVTYTGKFQIPAQLMTMKGKPGWTWGNDGYTDSEAVTDLGIHPHMHFSSTTRVRIKPRNAPVNGQDLAGGSNSYNNASTININDWLNATRYNEGGLSNTTAGSNQPACWAIASGTLSGTEDSIQIVPLPPPLLLGSQVTTYNNFCRTGCELTNLRCYCLNNTNITYNLGRDWFDIPGTIIRQFVDSLIGCVPDLILGPTIDWNPSGTAPAQYLSGAASVPTDWKGTTLADVLPFNSNLTSTTAFPQAHNTVSETGDAIVATGVDPTIHNHKITFDKGTTDYKIITQPYLLEPDALNTTVRLFPSTVGSLDSVTSPYIVLEYLIKT